MAAKLADILAALSAAGIDIEGTETLASSNKRTARAVAKRTARTSTKRTSTKRTPAERTPAKRTPTKRTRVSSAVITCAEAWQALGSDPTYTPSEPNAPARNGQLWALNAAGKLALID